MFQENFNNEMNNILNDLSEFANNFIYIKDGESYELRGVIYFDNWQEKKYNTGREEEVIGMLYLSASEINFTPDLYDRIVYNNKEYTVFEKPFNYNNYYEIKFIDERDHTKMRSNRSR